jgi:Domain of unknown function (DUF4124)
VPTLHMPFFPASLRHCARVLAPIVMLAAISTPAMAAKTVYRCEKNGQITLTDQPCASSGGADETSKAEPTSAPPSASDFSPVGSWTGQILFQGIDNGRTMLDDHAVVLGNFEFTGDGKVSGLSQANGCKVLGTWSRGNPTSVVWLDIAFESCLDAQYNRRYHGSFLIAKPDSSGAFSVQAAEMPSIGQSHARNFDIKGTLRR